MLNKPVILIEDKIPFIKGRLEAYADVRYLAPQEFTPQAVKDADAMIIRTRTRCDAQLLSGSRVRCIATATIGTDHIDIDWCRSQGIAVYNAPGCNAPAVAQYVWASLLHARLDPSHMTIGIIGCGNVGSIVAEWGRELGARVITCDPPRKISEPSFPHTPLEQLLPQCNVVTIHTPLTKTGPHPTFHLLNKEMLSLCCNDCIIINAARGPVVDTEALIEHCHNSSCSTIIDCWEGEPDINLDLLDLSGIATPHIAGYSLEGKQRATRMAIEATIGHLIETRMLPPTVEIEIDLSDLPGEYASFSEDDYFRYNIPGDKSLKLRHAIMASYDPRNDTRALRNAPADFEQLRARYDYRREPHL